MAKVVFKSLIRSWVQDMAIILYRAGVSRRVSFMGNVMFMSNLRSKFRDSAVDS